MSDDELVERVAAGDKDAFAEIFDRYAQGLLGFCVHMLGSREGGEDALQLTFVAAYKALGRGNSTPTSLRPWLYAIAHNRCVSELRARPKTPDPEWAAADYAAFEGAPSLVARREQLREIIEDIQRLPTDQRAALVLFELGGYSHAEIADILGVRPEKIRALVFQARQGLLRGRNARDSQCSEIQERLSSTRGKIPARSLHGRTSSVARPARYSSASSITSARRWL